MLSLACRAALSAWRCAAQAWLRSLRDGTADGSGMSKLSNGGDHAAVDEHVGSGDVADGPGG